MSLNVTEVTDVDESPAIKPVPKFGKLKYSYAPSHDGIDENLLILLHGFGDSNIGFAKLGKSFKLPQTATMAIRGPELIPFLLDDDPEGFQWFPTYDNLGEKLARPNPSAVLNDLLDLIRHLADECHWSTSKIHMFGFGQGGSIASELALKVWKAHKFDGAGDLGSLVTISGPLLSYPASTGASKACETPLLIVHRPTSQESEFGLSKSDLTAFKKGFGGRIIEEKLRGEKGGMPSSREEWLPIMQFWSDVLSRRMMGIQGQGLYQVVNSKPVDKNT